VNPIGIESLSIERQNTHVRTTVITDSRAQCVAQVTPLRFNVLYKKHIYCILSLLQRRKSRLLE